MYASSTSGRFAEVQGVIQGSVAAALPGPDCPCDDMEGGEVRSPFLNGFHVCVRKARERCADKVIKRRRISVVSRVK